jgi:sigma-B regulation protein RsbU (phosphoserine phosphatase)
VHAETLTSAAGADPLRRLEALTEAGLADLGVEELLVELLDRVRELLSADTAAVLLLDQAEQSLVATAARGIEEEIRQGTRVPLGRGFAGRVAARKEPVIVERVDHTTVVNPILWEKGIQSLLGVPLVAGGAAIGVLHVGTLSRRHFTTEDTTLLQVAADRIALATQSRLLRVERAAAVTLQRSLLPAKLSSIAGVELASRYVPGGDGDVGGDWYDVFELPFDRLCVVVGDVMGRGVPAAAAMGRIRSALRAHALRVEDPATALQELDIYMRHFEPSLHATVLCAIVEPKQDRLILSTAGHPPPVKAQPGRPPEILTLPADLLLGVDPTRFRHTTAVDLPVGSGILFYTDGLIERRGVSLDVGLERLRAAVNPGPAEAACARVMLEMVGNEVVDDDVAVLMLSRTDAT